MSKNKLKSKRYIIIPARLDSTRLPKKMLLRETGQSLLQHTWENCNKVPSVDKVYIGTPDEEIYIEAMKFGANVIKTDKDCKNGTECVIDAAKQIPAKNDDIIINCQADYPNIDQLSIANLAQKKYKPTEISSLYYIVKNELKYQKPDFVKVVTTWQNHSMYFSRLPIPHNSDSLKIHVGIYSFMYSDIMTYTLGQANNGRYLTDSEDLEQLKWLNYGGFLNEPYNYGLFVSMFKTDLCISIDTNEDYEEFCKKKTS
jgi:3-deoxy-manno-octulosonate cytidylyltransferase (CMP-KDO synthetase)